MKLHDAMLNYLKIFRKQTTFIKNLEIDLQMYHSHIYKLMYSEYSKYSNWYWGLIWPEIFYWFHFENSSVYPIRDVASVFRLF